MIKTDALGNFLVNMISGLLAYAYDPNKPKLHWGSGGFTRLPIVPVPDSLSDIRVS